MRDLLSQQISPTLISLIPTSIFLYLTFSGFVSGLLLILFPISLSWKQSSLLVTMHMSQAIKGEHNSDIFLIQTLHTHLSKKGKGKNRNSPLVLNNSDSVPVWVSIKSLCILELDMTCKWHSNEQAISFVHNGLFCQFRYQLWTTYGSIASAVGVTFTVSVYLTRFFCWIIFSSSIVSFREG